MRGHLTLLLLLCCLHAPGQQQYNSLLAFDTVAPQARTIVPYQHTYHIRYHTYAWQRPLIMAGLAFVSGASWGVHETVVHHPDNIPAGWNQQYWDNRISWRNKYAGGLPENGPKFFGSTSFLVWTTDAKHLFAATHRATLFGAGVCVAIGERRPWYAYAIDVGISFAAFSIGFHSMYNIAFSE